MSALHFYVYYEVAEREAEATLAIVHAMQAALVVETSIRARLQRRADSSTDARQIWMELYPDAPAGFEARLASAVESSGLASRTGPRHVERFEDIA